MKKLIPFALLPLVLLSACGKDDEDAKSSTPPSGSVELGPVASDGCLNVPAYFSGIRSMHPDLPVLEVSNDLELSSKKQIRPKFRTLMSYTTFSFKEKPLSQFNEFQSFSQNGCDILTAHGVDGVDEEFKVTESSPEKLVAKHEDGRSYEYTWLSPKSMMIEIRYFAYDLPCSAGEEPTPILVRHRRTLDWSGEVPATIAQDSPLNIKPSYLFAFAEAVGRTASEIYESGSLGDNALNSAKLREFQGLPIREEYLTCGGSFDPPVPPPEEP